MPTATIATLLNEHQRPSATTTPVFDVVAWVTMAIAATARETPESTNWLFSSRHCISWTDVAAPRKVRVSPILPITCKEGTVHGAIDSSDGTFSATLTAFTCYYSRFRGNQFPLVGYMHKRFLIFDF